VGNPLNATPSRKCGFIKGRLANIVPSLDPYKGLISRRGVWLGPVDSHENCRLNKKQLAKTCGCGQERLTHILMDHDLHPNPQGGAFWVKGREEDCFWGIMLGEIECTL